MKAAFGGRVYVLSNSVIDQRIGPIGVENGIARSGLVILVGRGYYLSNSSVDESEGVSDNC